MRGIVIVILSVFTLTACSGFGGFGSGGGGEAPPQRAPLLLREANPPEPVHEVPPDGIVPVQRGDTIFTLANRYQVPPQQIIALNDLAAPFGLGGFTTINLPRPRGHLVVPGDTLETISARYGVNPDDLISINVLIPPYDLRAGMELVIPREYDPSSIARIESVATTATRAPKPLEVAPPALTPEKPPAVEAPKVAETPPASIANNVRFSESAAGFTWPVSGTIIERFGNTSARGVHNDGVNIAAATDTPVRASQSGEVAFVGSGLKSFGNLVLIKHDGGWITAYAHLGDVWVTEGDRLTRGDVIGTVGQSGRVDSPQLHFELRKAREPVNPEDHLS